MKSRITNTGKAFFIGLALVLCSSFLSAQEDVNVSANSGEAEKVFAVILYASGDEMSVFREGELITYSIFEDDVIGLPLLEGDMVQTANNSFVEMQMIPSQNIIKVAENTTFEISKIRGEEGGSFELLYGRVRAKVAALSGDDNFSIRGRTAVAGVRGTDFGFDYVTRVGGSIAPATSIYCFEGSVEVAPQDDPAGSGESVDDAGSSSTDDSVLSRAVLISANEMVEVLQQNSSAESGNPAVQTVLSQQKIQPEIMEYWRNNSFQSTPIDPEKIEQVFPGIFQMLEQAIVQAEVAAQLKAYLESGNTLAEYRESQSQPVELTSTVTAFPTIQSIGIASLIPEIETKVYRPNELKITGGVFGVMGTLLETTGLILYFLGDDLGLDPAVSQSYGPVLLASGGISLFVSLTSLIIDAAR